MLQETEPPRNSEWADSLEHSVPETVIASAQGGCMSPELTNLHVRLSARRLPDGQAAHFHAHLGDTLLHIYERGAEALRERLLPPSPASPLDLLFFHARDGKWCPQTTSLEVPLWEALAEGMTRHLGIEYRLVIRINSKWGVAKAEQMTPRELLVEFGFDPTQFSLYRHDSSQVLPPDTQIHLHRGEHFEAQKDGKYGGMESPSIVRGLQRIEDDVEQMTLSCESIRLASDGAQRYVETTIQIPSPPWSASTALILIAVPANYPTAGLDAFYLDATINIGGSIHRAQLVGPILGKRWNLISWHYSAARPWNPRTDDLQTHVAHCRGFFLQRGVVSQ